MSTSLGEAYVKIGARLDALERGLKDARRQTEDSSRAMAGAIKLVGVAWAGLAAIRSGAGLLEGVFGSAMDRDRAVSGLTSAMKVTGRYSDEAAERFARQAEELGRLPGITEAQVREMQSFGIQAGHSAELTEALVRSAVGLGAVTGDAHSAMKALSEETEGIPNEKLSKALGGPLLNITDQMSRLRLLSERAYTGIDGLKDRLGSASGKVESIGKTFEKLKEDIGQVFVEMVADNQEGILAFLNRIRDIVPTLPGHFKMLAANIGEFGEGLKDFFQPVIDSMKWIIERGKDVKQALGWVSKQGDEMGERWGRRIFGDGNKSGAAYDAERGGRGFKGYMRYRELGPTGFEGDPIVGGDGASLLDVPRPAKGAEEPRIAVNAGNKWDRMRQEGRQAIELAEGMTAARNAIATVAQLRGNLLESLRPFGAGREGPALGKADTVKVQGGSVQGINEFLASLAQAGADSAVKEQLDVAKQQLEVLNDIKDGVTATPTMRR